MGKGRGDRDSALDIIPYGCVFDLDIQPLNDAAGDPIAPSDLNWEFVKRIYIKSKSEKNKQLAFTVSGLDYRRWYFRLRPYVENPGVENGNTIRLDTNGNPQSTSTNTDTGRGDGSTIVITAEQRTEDIDNDDVEETILENYDKRSASSDAGAPIKITSVSEQIYPADIGANTTYEGIAMAGVKIKASDRLNTAPDLSLFITEGRQIRNHLYFGTSESNGTTLIDTEGNFLANPDISAGASIVRNLETGIQGTITGTTTTNITSAVNFSVGDRFIVFNLMSSNYFPDIYVDMLINPEGGLGSLVDGDNYIDYASIVAANEFVKNEGFFWDGVLDQEQEFSEWASEEASFSRLIPLKVEGRFGLVIEQPGIPLRGVFNESNIIKDSFTEENVPWQENEVNQVVLTITNGNDLQRPITAVTARTQDVNDGLAKLNTFNVQAPSITDIEQAKNIAGVFLKSKRLQNKSVKFRTALQGIYLSPGDLIIVQHQITEFDFETSGYVTAIDTYDGVNLTQKFALSRQFPTPGGEAGYAATIQLQSTGEIIENVGFTAIVEFGQPFIQLDNGVLPATLSVGDPVLIGRTTTIDRKYRIQSLNRSEDGSVEIAALNWNEDMFDLSDIILITE